MCDDGFFYVILFGNQFMGLFLQSYERYSSLEESFGSSVGTIVRMVKAIIASACSFCNAMKHSHAIIAYDIFALLRSQYFQPKNSKYMQQNKKGTFRVQYFLCAK